jgi:hypothetical protein
MSRLVLPEGHNWQELEAAGWLRGNEYAWECTDCGQSLFGVMETDGSFDLLDLADVQPCSRKSDIEE